MIWQDGHYHIERDGPAQAPISGQPPSRLQNVIDNLTQRKQIPVAVYVLIDPGRAGTRAMRSIEYDTVSDLYPRFLRDEVLPEIYSKYNVRKDGYSHAIAGNSSGGICAFNAAWYMPELFSRVVARVPSFTAIQWKPGEQDGGNIYPFRVRREAKRNIRVWTQDGSEDMEAGSGSWPLQNLQMANSLKIKGYDFHFSFGTGTHNHAQNNSEMPDALTWLWRDYDPAKTEQTFEHGGRGEGEARLSGEDLQSRLAGVETLAQQPQAKESRAHEEHRSGLGRRGGGGIGVDDFCRQVCGCDLIHVDISAAARKKVRSLRVGIDGERTSAAVVFVSTGIRGVHHG